MEDALIAHRFIPACAGNASTTSSPIDTSAVHPRVCGERGGSSGNSATTGGSSPRVRGTQLAAGLVPVRPRFIPACAGNARARAASARSAAVHPRVCGERVIRQFEADQMIGSSPRVRGTRCATPCSATRRRFIPACAGNAPATSTPRPRWPVHPRVCGERQGCVAKKSEKNGSSPRVRGTRFRETTPLRRWRFIPACAGNAVWRW